MSKSDDHRLMFLEQAVEVLARALIEVAHEADKKGSGGAVLSRLEKRTLKDIRRLAREEKWIRA